MRLTPAIPSTVISPIAITHDDAPTQAASPSTAAGTAAEVQDQAFWSMDKVAGELKTFIGLLREAAKADLFSGTTAERSELLITALEEASVAAEGGIFDPEARLPSTTGKPEAQLEACTAAIDNLRTFVDDHTRDHITHTQFALCLGGIALLLLAAGAIVAVAKGRLLNPPTLGGIALSGGACFGIWAAVNCFKTLHRETTRADASPAAIKANLATLTSNLNLMAVAKANGLDLSIQTGISSISRSASADGKTSETGLPAESAGDRICDVDPHRQGYVREEISGRDVEKSVPDSQPGLADDDQESQEGAAPEALTASPRSTGLSFEKRGLAVDIETSGEGLPSEVLNNLDALEDALEAQQQARIEADRARKESERAREELRDAMATSSDLVSAALAEIEAMQQALRGTAAAKEPGSPDEAPASS